MSKKKAAWTVMVYLAGDNNLSSECLFALTEMKKAAPGKQINVIAQFDPQDNFLPTHRYEINRKGQNSTLFDDIIDAARYDIKTGEVHFKRESREAKLLAKARLRDRERARQALAEGGNEVALGSPIPEDEVITDDTDTGSPITLYNFLSFCFQEYPADHYMVVLSGHAGGTERDYLLKDESSTGSLTFNELKQVFRQLREDRGGQSIEIVGMDNCLMSMAEICYELRGLTEIVVGCESYSPASGWPYRQVIERLRKDFVSASREKKSLRADVAKALVEEYVNYYSSYWMSGMSVSQSALDVSKVEKLRKLVDKLADTLTRELSEEHQTSKQKQKGHPFKDAIVLAHWEAQSFNGEQFVDIYDFCDCLEKRVTSPSVVRRCRELKRFISSEFVLGSCYSGAAYQYSYGASLYFPWSQVASSYDNLDFIKNSDGLGWGRFLRAYTLITRREPRGMDNKSRLSEASSAFSFDVRMSSDRMSSDRMSSDRMSSDRMSSDRMSSDRMSSDRMSSDRMSSDRMSSDRMSSDRSGNPIHSMRNPPIVFVPDDCLKEPKKVLRSQRTLFG